MQCEPAFSIIKTFGGLTEVAKIVGATPNAVMRWRWPRERGGTGGVIPHWHVGKLLAAAEERKLGVGMTEFMPKVDAGKKPEVAA